MNIKVPRIDGRTRIGDIPHPIIDLDTGQRVGTIECRQGTTTSTFDDHSRTFRRYHSRTISLIDDKYRGSFETHAECVAFAKGVEAVINQAIAPKDHPRPKGYEEFTLVMP
jgi:hypothetical protein